MISRPNVKINLGLNVLKKREDGFHDIETLFVPSDEYHDTLEIITGDDYSRTSAGLFSRYGNATSPDGAPCLVQGISGDGKLMITIARPDGVDWEPLQDLTAKAYSLLDGCFNLPPVKIFLEKTSPTGAGLGGGSADAAFALKMLNELFSLGIDETGMASFAAKLGSDCAFFIYNRPMLGRGKGEILEDFPPGILSDGRYELKIVVPEGISVSTADAYRGITPRIPELPVSQVLLRPVEEWKQLLVNDFEATVFIKYPRLRAVKESLYNCGAVYASMSGSGCACYGIFEKQ